MEYRGEMTQDHENVEIQLPSHKPAWSLARRSYQMTSPAVSSASHQWPGVLPNLLDCFLTRLQKPFRFRSGRLERPSGQKKIVLISLGPISQPSRKWSDGVRDIRSTAVTNWSAIIVPTSQDLSRSKAGVVTPKLSFMVPWIFIKFVKDIQLSNRG